MKLARTLSALLVLAFFTTSCVSTTVLRTNQTGAKITVDGRYLGDGTVHYSDSKTIGSATFVEIEKPGFKKKTATIFRDSQVKAGPIVGAVLLFPVGLLFLLWVYDYAPTYSFDLEPEEHSKK